MMLNELSIQGQFCDSTTLRQAIGRVMAMRSVARRFRREVYCHRNVQFSTFNPNLPLVRLLSHAERRSVLTWLSKRGPFWEDARQHDPGEWFECDSEVVTDTGLAEAAYCSYTGIDRRMISLTPSTWERTPIIVTWRRDPTPPMDIRIGNYWDPTRLEADLRTAEPPTESWQQLEETSHRRFRHLSFTTDTFRYLEGQPFSPGVATRVLSRLDVLDRLRAAGLDSAEGRRLYDDHFIGDRAWFSDSSDSEKRRFRRGLTFQSPEPGEEPLFCTWHGKVNNPPYRIHFNWPVPPGRRLHVVYVGLKITRR